MILEELEVIRSAAQALAVREGVATDRLLDASAQLWSAMYEMPEWPSEVDPSARRILDQVTANGSVETTLPEMDKATALDVADEIIHLAEALEGENHVKV